MVVASREKYKGITLVIDKNSLVVHIHININRHEGGAFIY
jgi:hypothetical protein